MAVAAGSVIYGGIPAAHAEESSEVAPAEVRVTWLPDQAQRDRAELAADVGVADELPDKLVIPPGRYAVAGQIYNLRREGAYRIRIGDQRLNRIAFAKRPSALLSGLAWYQRHSVFEDDRYYAQDGWVERYEEIANRQKLQISCGVVSALAVELLRRRGFEARRVSLLTDSELVHDDSYGHTLMEVRIGRSWKLFDVDYDMKPLVDGRATTITRWARLGAGSRAGFDWLASDRGTFGGFTELPQPYLDVLGTPLIEDGGYFYYFRQNHPADEIDGFTNGWYRHLPRADFMARFYGA